MAILKIARMGHPVLRRPAAPVEAPDDPEIQRLIADMIETMLDAPGIGLAAPQVHVSRRIIVFHVPRDRVAEGESDAPPGVNVLINPEIVPLGDEVAVGWEGCLSMPGLRGAVPRPARIRYRGLDASGTRVEREASGLHARVVQHEIDHLDGILFIDRMPDLTQLSYEEELRYRRTGE